MVFKDVFKENLQIKHVTHCGFCDSDTDSEGKLKSHLMQ